MYGWSLKYIHLIQTREEKESQSEREKRNKQINPSIDLNQIFWVPIQMDLRKSNHVAQVALLINNDGNYSVEEFKIRCMFR